MNRSIRWAAAALTILSALGTAGASPLRRGVEASAAYRLLANGLSDVTLDERGTTSGQNAWLEQRLRLLSTIHAGNLRVTYGGDLFSGLLAGETSRVGERFLDHSRNELEAHRRYELRRAMLTWRTPYGELRAGHQVSDWGYGILANSGEHELPFGDQRLGDLVERLAFATMPRERLYVVAGADLVYRDANAELLEGDRGLNVIGAVFHQLGRRFLGLYIAHRSQWDRDDERLEVTVVDLHARHGGDLPAGLRWEAGLEGMLQSGTTSRVRAEPDLDGSDILAGGAVVRGELSHGRAGLKLSLEAGLATGDNNLNDDTVHQATFHPDYRVGMIMFDEFLGGVTARAADRLADAPHQASIPHGTRHVPTAGGVTNAVYLWPRITYEPLSRLAVQAGLLWGRAVADVIDPGATNFEGGGYNRNYFGGAADGRGLGLELQVGLGYRWSLLRNLELGLAAQWARFMPGSAFEDAAGRRPPSIDRVVGRAVLDWRYQ